jgi:hypothetical protein
MKPLVEMTRITKDACGTDARVRTVRDSVRRVLVHCTEGVREAQRRDWTGLLKILRSSRKGQISTKPFQVPMDPPTVDRYIDLWTQCIVFCWRFFDSSAASGSEGEPDSESPGPGSEQETGSESAFDLLTSLTEMDGLERLTAAQQREFQSLRLILRDPDNIDEAALDRQTFALSISLIQHSAFQPTPSFLLYFCDVMAWDVEQARWKDAFNYTQFLAGIHYCMRILGLECAWPQRLRDYYVFDPQHTPAHMLADFHSQWLVQEGCSVFSTIHDRLNYGFRVNRGYRSTDQLRFSQEGDLCYYGEGVIEMKDWKPMISSLIDRAERILSRNLLFRDQDTVDIIDPYSIVDDERKSDAGHSFVHLNPSYRSDAREVIIRALSRIPRQLDKYMPYSNGQRQFTAKAKNMYTKDDEKLRELLLLIMVFTSGQTGRGMESLTLRYENQQNGRRNIFVKDGQISIITSYHKSQGVTDQVKVWFSML